jgi:cytochrome c oxidase assembly protein subunit 15
LCSHLRLLGTTTGGGSSSAIFTDSYVTISADSEKFNDSVVQDRIAYWLFACCAIVFGIVVLGGVTRLTRSGLSMVEWKPFSIFPPSTEEEWQAEFSRYKGYPEYLELGREMPLSEFKFIYFMEFSHRLAGSWLLLDVYPVIPFDAISTSYPSFDSLAFVYILPHLLILHPGRVLGIFFGVPALFLASRGYLSPALRRRFLLLFSLGGVQATVGWWMVSSGLETTVHSYNDLPRVSPYRLATHLITAFAIYSLLFTTGLRLLSSAHTLRLLRNQISRSQSYESAPLYLRRMSMIVAKLVGVTAFSGAFVAGNEAGLVHSDFPKMGGEWVPSDLINDAIQPLWKNVFENSTMVQFNHRNLVQFHDLNRSGIVEL